jgi:mannose-6-phosphate isomerase
LTGTNLADLLRDHGPGLLGTSLAGLDQFPLLVKYLDAHQVLSVQVHPDDELGRRLVGDNGKTEAWVVLHAEPESLIYAGLRAGVTPEEFAAGLGGDGLGLEPLLHRVPARAGDCFLIRAGTVHAIGSGVLLAEIQQMSDATFRVHDWGRRGADGRPRPLHPAEALQSIDFDIGPVGPVIPEVVREPWGRRERLARSPYFVLERLNLSGRVRVGDPARFTLLLGLDGTAHVHHEGVAYPLATGETILLPAILGGVDVSGDPGASILTCVAP